MSDCITEGVRVGARAFYLPAESAPEEKRYLFGYRIVIVNEGDRQARLLSRHWVIIDAHGKQEEVRGPGVVGQTPLLLPGQGFKYTSYCPLETTWGTMEGSYEMERDDGSRFRAIIKRFYLAREHEDAG